jgi:dihydrofolate reductase
MIKLIAACDLNLGIGFENKLLVSLQNDMKHFKQTTTNGIVCMGRLTYESIGKLLPNRTNIILSSNPNYKVEGAYVYNSIDDVLRHYHSYFIKTDLYFIGGEKVYSQALEYADEVILTIICNKFSQVDSYFPELGEEWKLKDSDKHVADDQNEFTHWICTYERRNLSKR